LFGNINCEGQCKQLKHPIFDILDILNISSSSGQDNLYAIYNSLTSEAPAVFLFFQGSQIHTAIFHLAFSSWHS
jgi:hypothetical protein